MDITNHLKGDLPEKTIKLDGESTVTFKPITPKQFEDIQDKHSVEKFKRGQPRTKTNWKKVIDEILALTVITWTGLTNEGVDIEVNDVNRRRMYDNYNTFRAAFTDVVMEGLGDERDFAEELEGN